MNLVVYCSGARAGMLDMADSEPFYGFTYDPAYLASPHAVPLSLSLPLQEGRFSGESALPFFEGLLPEGDVRATVARQLGISERSPAKLLRALGKDCAGDVAVLEEDDPYQPPSDGVYLPLEGGLEAVASNPYGTISRIRAGNRLSLAGGQEKIALYHDSRRSIDEGWYVPMEGSPSTHIVKPQVLDAFPHMASNEFICMKLAELVGIRAAQVHLLSFERPLLVVERFDRRPLGKTNENGLELFGRLRQEDFCQALGFSSDRKYEADGGPGISDMVGLLLAHSVRLIQDRDALLRLVVFNYLIGNCDAHAKNYSVMLGAAGTVKLAPAYDIVSTTVYDGSFGSGLSRGMGMRIGAHTNIDRVDRGDFEQLSRSLGLRPSYVTTLAKDLATVIVEQLGEAVETLSEIDPQGADALAPLLRKGIQKRAALLS